MQLVVDVQLSLSAIVAANRDVLRRLVCIPFSQGVRSVIAESCEISRNVERDSNLPPKNKQDTDKWGPDRKSVV